MTLCTHYIVQLQLTRRWWIYTSPDRLQKQSVYRHAHHINGTIIPPIYTHVHATKHAMRGTAWKCAVMRNYLITLHYDDLNLMQKVNWWSGFCVIMNIVNGWSVERVVIIYYTMSIVCTSNGIHSINVNSARTLACTYALSHQYCSIVATSAQWYMWYTTDKGGEGGEER